MTSFAMRASAAAATCVISWGDFNATAGPAMEAAQAAEAEARQLQAVGRELAEAREALAAANAELAATRAAAAREAAVHDAQRTLTLS